MSASIEMEVNVSKVLKIIETLSNSEQEFLFDIPKQHSIEKRRQEMADNIAEAHQEYKLGETKNITVDELMADLDE